MKKSRRGFTLIELLVVMAIIAPVAAMLIQMAVSRAREYLADAAGARIRFLRCASCMSVSGVEGLPVDPACLNDHCERLALAREQRDILERIAVDQQQVGLRAGCNNAQLALALQHGGHRVDLLGEHAQVELGVAVLHHAT